MKKNQRKKVGIILVSAIFLISILSIGLISSAEPFCPGETGIITSMSEVNFQSTSSDFGGPTWIVGFNTIPSGQCVYGDFDASEIKDGDEEVTHGFAIDLINKDQTCNYNIQSTGECSYSISSRYYSYWDDDEADDKYEECRAELDNPYTSPLRPKIWGGGLFSDKYVACFDKWAECSNQFGKIYPPILDWETEIIFDNKLTGDRYSESISSGGDRALTIEPGKVRAYWTGNLVDSEWCPAETQSYAVKWNNQWILTDSNPSTQFNNMISDFESCKIGIDTENEIYICTNRLTDDVNSLHDSDGSICTNNNECGIVSGNSITIDTSQDIAIPTFTLNINADVLGVFQEFGEPQIVKVETEDLVSERNARVYVTAKNIGDGIGSFDLWISCPSPFEVLSTTTTFSLQPGAESVIPITLTGMNADDVSRTCTAYLKERTTGEQDTKTFLMNMIGSNTICEPVGLQTCINNNIEECKLSGDSTFVEDCGDDMCVVLEGIASCKDISTKTTCKDCWNYFGNTFVPEEDECIAATFYEFKLGDFINIDGGPVLFELKQTTICPIMIVIVFSISSLLVYTIVLVFKKRKKISKKFKGKKVKKRRKK